MYAIRYRNQWVTIRENCWSTIENAKNVTKDVWFAANQTALNHEKKILPNQSLQPTANPLRGLSAAELGRYTEETH